MLLPIGRRGMFVLPLGSVFILFLILNDIGFGVNGEDIILDSWGHRYDTHPIQFNCRSCLILDGNGFCVFLV